ncbi:MAG: PepSY domain-containing protein [Gammaproteobacteria bacterium]
MNESFLLNRKPGIAIGAVAAGLLCLGSAQAGHGSHGGHDHSTAELSTCLKQVYKIKGTDDFVKVEYLSVTQEGSPSFEIEVRDAKGVEWEFMCDAASGMIYEVEQEVESAGDPKFKKHAKVSEQQATKTVTDLYAGEVKEVEYEIEANGDATYEIDVVDDNDTEWKVEVDAASGDIIETHIEQWEIGEEPDERS